MNPFANWTPAQVEAFNARHKPKLKQDVAPEPVEFKAVLTMRLSSDEEKLNKTEREYLRILQGHANQWIGVQSVTLKLGHDCRYTPDFVTVGHYGELTFHEVKGFMRDDALVKLKTAARMFRWARFMLVRKTKTGWEETEVKP